MNDKTVDKQKLLDEIKDKVCCVCLGDERQCEILVNYGEPCAVALKIAAKLVYDGYRRQPEGEWIQQMRPYEDEIECSVCNERFNILDNCTEKFDFCPNCGAKMKGGESDGR